MSADNNGSRVARPSRLLDCIPDGLPTPPESAFAQLNNAQDRYFTLNRLTDKLVSEEQAVADREQFAHLHECGVISFGPMVEFLHLATGLPWGWCVTWAYLDAFAVANNVVALAGVDRETFIEEHYRAALQLLDYAKGSKQ
jgi:hypothetical protein